jgi:guanylate kinase
MRSDEKNGRKYWHISQEDFEKSIDNNEFLEYAIVHAKHYYGTKISEIEQAFAK